MIFFRWYGIKWRDLTGPEKHRPFIKVNLITLFPQISEISELWSNFYSIIQSLHSGCDHTTLETSVKAWVKDFCFLYQTKHVTPYVHALAMHVPEFIRLYGNPTKFTEQGLEKLNDLTTTHYLRSTNPKDMDALQQLIMKRNRLENLKLEGFQCQKRKCTCSKCGQTGHNKRKCLQELQVNQGLSSVSIVCLKFQQLLLPTLYLTMIQKRLSSLRSIQHSRNGGKTTES